MIRIISITKLITLDSSTFSTELVQNKKNGTRAISKGVLRVILLVKCKQVFVWKIRINAINQFSCSARRTQIVPNTSY